MNKPPCVGCDSPGFCDVAGCLVDEQTRYTQERRAKREQTERDRRLLHRVRGEAES
jgi:hypothetical protein